MNKKLYGEIFIHQDELRSNGNYNKIRVDYYKTEKLEEPLKSIGSFKYGIEVVKTEFKENEENIEVNQVYEISNNENEVDFILEKLKNNEVTPITVQDVIKDLLYE